MEMIKKVSVAVGIFVLLFSGAWMLDIAENTKLSSTENSVNVENKAGLMNVTNNPSIEPVSRKPFVLKFQPREYVRIEQK